jgi:hypothetical protein
MGLFWAHSPDFSPRRGYPGPFPRCQPGFAIESPPAEHEVSCWSFQSGGKAGERRGAGDADGSSYEQARAIYDYVIANMTYDKSGEGWGLGDAIYACNDKKGNCTDFHSLFIAIARSRGIPARFTIGFPLGAPTTGKIPGYHCWAEFYSGGQWVPVDASEAWKHPQLRPYYLAISTPTGLRSRWAATWC